MAEWYVVRKRKGRVSEALSMQAFDLEMLCCFIIYLRSLVSHDISLNSGHRIEVISSSFPPNHHR